MNFVEKKMGGTPVFEIEGKVMGGLNSLALQDRLKGLISSGEKNIILDLSRVEWINSPGMGIMLASLTTIRRNGGDLHFVGLGERIAHYFKITKLDTVVRIYPTRDDALQELSRSKPSQ